MNRCASYSMPNPLRLAKSVEATALIADARIENSMRRIDQYTVSGRPTSSR